MISLGRAIVVGSGVICLWRGVCLLLGSGLGVVRILRMRGFGGRRLLILLVENLMMDDGTEGGGRGREGEWGEGGGCTIHVHVKVGANTKDQLN